MANTNNQSDIATVVAYAKAYANEGWRVFPLHYITENKNCSCGDNCSRPGKHPLINHWPQTATIDFKIIKAWWDKWPKANIGILTGKGLFVLDVDVKGGKEGIASVAALEAKNGEFPPTRQVRTGSGGLHYYFDYREHAETYLPKSVNRLGSGLDVMTEGGYVVAPPSKTINAQGEITSYTFVNQHVSASLPDWLFSLVRGQQLREQNQSKVLYGLASNALLGAVKKRLVEHGPAIQGQGGDQHTFCVGAILLHDFALRWDDAWKLALEWNKSCQPSWIEADLQTKLEHGEKYAKGIYGDAREAFEVSEGLRSSLRLDGSQLPEGLVLPAFREHVFRTGRTLEDVYRDGYSPEDIAFFCESQKTTNPKFWETRWMIQHNQVYWLWFMGRYVGPIQGRETVLDKAQRLLSPAYRYVKFFKVQGKKAINLTLTEFLSAYGSSPSRVIGRLDMQVSGFDAFADTFYDAVCPVRYDLVPTFSSEIDEWLRLLGGPQAEKLIAWVATVTQLRSPNACLYIKGRPSIGKGLFAEGLSRLWHQGGPTEFKRVYESFNESLTRCPLIVADEQLVGPWMQHVRGFLYNFIASSSRTLNRKYFPQVDLIGNIRLLLTSNNECMLEDSTESYSREDIEAMVPRFFFLDVDAERGEALQKLLVARGGREGTESWVVGDGIAKYALWLRDNYQLSKGSRFLVEGERSQMHDRLASSFGPQRELRSWLVCYLMNPAKTQTQVANRFRAGNGVFLVTTEGIATVWSHYSNVQSPSISEIGQELKHVSLCKKQRQYGGLRSRFYEVDIDELSRFAEDRGIGDPQTIRERVNAVDSSWSW